MYYKVIDNKKDKWIVLLHCICANMHIFDNYTNKLSEKYNLLLIDLPGHGKSNEYNGKIDFREVAVEIIKIVEQLSVEKFSIWGISLGGVIAKYLLELVPQKIEKIIFEGPAFGIENKFYSLLFRLFNKIKCIFPKKLYLTAFVFAVIPEKSQRNIRRIIYNELQSANYNTIDMWLTKLCEEFKFMNYKFLNKSEVNKEYILGEKDYIFKNTIINNIIENENNRIIIKKNCGHLCHLESGISL